MATWGSDTYTVMCTHACLSDLMFVPDVSLESSIRHTPARAVGDHMDVDDVPASAGDAVRVTPTLTQPMQLECEISCAAIVCQWLGRSRAPSQTTDCVVSLSPNRLCTVYEPLCHIFFQRKLTCNCRTRVKCWFRLSVWVGLSDSNHSINCVAPLLWQHVCTQLVQCTPFSDERPL